MRGIMNFESVLDLIQNFRAQLDAWGLSATGLLFIGLGAFLVFLYSLREIVIWFFKLHALRRDIEKLHSKVDALTEMLTRLQTAAPTTLGEPAPVAKVVAKDPSQFRLDH